MVTGKTWKWLVYWSYTQLNYHRVIASSHENLKCSKNCFGDMKSLWKNLRVKIDLENRKLLCITEILIHSFQKYSLSTNSWAVTSQDLSRHKSTIIHHTWLSAWRNIEWGKKNAFTCEGQGNSSGKVTSQQRSEGRDGLSGDSWRISYRLKEPSYKSSLFIFKDRRATLSSAEATKGKMLVNIPRMMGIGVRMKADAARLSPWWAFSFCVRRYRCYKALTTELRVWLPSK